jgi:hypothetical protein
VKYVFANTTSQSERKLNPHANTPAAVQMIEIGIVLNIFVLAVFIFWATILTNKQSSREPKHCA